MEPVLGPRSVLVLDGAEHLRQHKLLLPPFQGSRVAAFRAVIQDAAQREIAGWRPGTKLVLRDRMRALTFDVICRAVFGVTDPDRVARLRSALVAVIDSSPAYMLSPLLRRDLGPLSPGRRNPTALSRLRAEIETSDGDAYLDAVVKETFRLRPVIDAAERTLTRTRTVAGWQLPAGVKVFPATAIVQMREDLYPRAREFRPQRFLDGRAEPYTWVPFGGGIRRCLGAALAQAEMAEVLRVVVPAVQLRPVRERPDPVVLRGITLAPRHGVQVEVTG